MESVLCNCSAHEYNRRCYSLILEGIASHSNVDAQTCPPVLSAVCDVVRSVRALTPPSARCATPARQRQSFRSPFASPLPCLLVPLLVHRHSSSLSPRLKSCRRLAVRPHSLVDATKAHPSIPVRPCHACRARRLSSRVPARSATCFVGHVVAYAFIHFSFVCFPLSCLRPSLVALFFSFPLISPLQSGS